MKIYRCGECSEDCRSSFRIAVHVQTTSTEHAERNDFCSIGCLTDWAAEYGYRDDDKEW